jgi:hypothetical protein
MLGITVPDAIAVGTLVAAALAGLFGKKGADALLKAKPLDPVASGVAAGFVDKDLMLRLVESNETIAVALKALVAAELDERQHAVDEKLERLEAAITKRNEDDERARRSTERVEKTIERATGRKLPPR